MADEKEKKDVPVTGPDGEPLFEGNIVDVPISINSVRIAAGNDGKVWCFLDAGDSTWHGIGVPVNVAVPFAEALLSCVASMMVPGLKAMSEDLSELAPGAGLIPPLKKEEMN